MTEILAFANQKGGVGKTTSAVNMAASLAYLGKKVLLVDMDPQGNATTGVGVNKRTLTRSVYELLTGQCAPADALYRTAFENLYLIPSTMALAGADLELAGAERRTFRLQDALHTLASYPFDFILVDCPPSLGLLNLNALTAATGVIIPMQCEYLALEGLSQLMYTVKQVQTKYNPTLLVRGVILTMYDGRMTLSVQVAEEIRRHFPGKTFRCTVPRNVRLSEAPSHGKPALYYDRYARGTLAYLEIAKELLDKTSN